MKWYCYKRYLRRCVIIVFIKYNIHLENTPYKWELRVIPCHWLLYNPLKSTLQWKIDPWNKEISIPYLVRIRLIPKSDRILPTTLASQLIVQYDTIAFVAKEPALKTFLSDDIINDSASVIISNQLTISSRKVQIWMLWIYTIIILKWREIFAFFECQRLRNQL